MKLAEGDLVSWSRHPSLRGTVIGPGTCSGIMVVDLGDGSAMIQVEVGSDEWVMVVMPTKILRPYVDTQDASE